MKLIFLIVFSFVLNHTYAQDTESKSRTGETNQIILLDSEKHLLKLSSESKEKLTPIVLKNNTSEKIVADYEDFEPIKKEKKQSRISKYLKKKPFIVADSIPTKQGFFQRLGCFLKEPLEFISLGVEMFELTKPPKNGFLVILYVIYIVPLFAIITVFISLGVSGLVAFILLCGGLSFLVYWGILALIGISLGGLFLLWGIIGAFIIGLILYLLLISLC